MSQRTLSVFEHQTVRAGVEVTQAELDALGRFHDRTKGAHFSLGHRSVRFTEHVGYVQVGSLAIEILPKADRNAPGDVPRWRSALLRMLEVALGTKLHTPDDAAQATTRSSLVELIARKLVHGVEGLLHTGLVKGYRDDVSNGPVYRGRLQVVENIRHNAARADRFFVRHGTYDVDVPANRVLKAALDALTIAPLRSSTRTRVAACALSFHDVSPAGELRSDLARIPRGRQYVRYDQPLRLARLVLEQHAPDLRTGQSEVFAILFDMNAVWEAYVTALFRRALGGSADVSAQESKPLWGPRGRAARTVRPDILVRSPSGGVLLAADAKWKVPAHGSPADDDLKQMFAYNELFAAPQALLVYPRAEASGPALRGPFAARAHGCATVHLDLFHDGRWNPDHAAATLRAAIDGRGSPAAG